MSVVVNPERADDADALIDALAAAGTEFDVRTPSDAGRMSDDVRAAARDGARVIAPVGGDGTQCQAAGALRGTDTSMVVVPAGTVNLLGQVIGIESIDDAVAAIRSGRTRELDVGLVGDDPFVLFASTGFDAAVIDDVDDRAKRLGVLGYALTGVRRLRANRPRRVVVHVDDDQVFDGRATNVIVANVAERGSAGFELAPGAAPDDGYLDAVIVRTETIGSMVRAGWALLRGRTPGRDDVAYARGRRIDVEWGTDVPAQRDGDSIGRRRRLTHRVAPERVSLCVPPGAT